MAFAIFGITTRRAIRLAAAVALALPVAAAAQITHNGNSDLTAINSGDISLRGDVSNPTVSGGTDNSAGNLAAQGASSSYSINDANLDAQGEPVGTSAASVSGTRLSGTNSGSVNVRATITGGSFAGNNASQSVSATGLSNVISIRTTSSK
ncbi:hypothetical protein [Novosphingobium sp. PASSN1]|uniref:hypothetical protein n=1 Tax=Novosphingobium sp. PASSN1 TaxID=2015561 RepID=UPI000BCB77B2|nr:hypothetical protein [Novosphingobium sp. PASSN1]OYU36068.1 MAG: hypothetical protein CFE35_07330 [Novosphingobium sp. PASSN1]